MSATANVASNGNITQQSNQARSHQSAVLSEPPNIARSEAATEYNIFYCLQGEHDSPASRGTTDQTTEMIMDEIQGKQSIR